MLRNLPDDVLITVTDHVTVLDLVTRFRLISKRCNRISRLAVIWARICRDYSILWPTTAPTSSPSNERRIASVARLDDRISTDPNIPLSPTRVQPHALDVNYPTALRVVPGGAYVLVESQPTTITLVNTITGTSRRLPPKVSKSSDRKTHYVGLKDFGDGAELVVVLSEGEQEDRWISLWRIPAEIFEDASRWKKSIDDLARLIQADQPVRYVVLVLSYLVLVGSETFEVVNLETHGKMSFPIPDGTIESVTAVDSLLTIAYSVPRLSRLAVYGFRRSRSPIGYAMDLLADSPIAPCPSRIPRFATSLLPYATRFPHGAVFADVDLETGTRTTIIPLDAVQFASPRFKRCTFTIRQPPPSLDRSAEVESSWSGSLDFAEPSLSPTSSHGARGRQTAKAVEVLGGTHHIFTQLSLEDGKGSSILHSRLLSDGTYHSRRVITNVQHQSITAKGDGRPGSREDADHIQPPEDADYPLMGWDELSGKLFLVTKSYSIEWEQVYTLKIVQY